MKTKSHYELVFTIVQILIGVQVQSQEFLAEDVSAWVRLCDKDNVYLGAEKSSSCSSGFWFNPPISIGCICGNGVWILSTGWCDYSYITLVLRKGECYFIGESNIKYIRNVGTTSNAFGEYYFAYSSGFEYIQGMSDGGNDPTFTYYHPNYDVSLGAIKSSKFVIVGKDGRTCVDSRERGVLTTFGYDSKMKEHVKRQGYTMGKSCPPDHDELADGDIRGFNYGFAAKARPANTTSTKNTTTYFRDDVRCAVCNGSSNTNKTIYYNPSWNPIGWGSLPNKTRQPLNSWSNSTSAKFPNEDYPESAEAMLAGYFEEPNCTDWKLSKGTREETLREISEQTKRMIVAHVGYSLKRIKAPSVNVSEYLQFQKARKVLLKVCPETEVPSDLLNGFIRMFRVALRESFLLYPHEEMQDTNENTLIAEALTNCLTDARPMEFLYENNTCPKKFLSINFTYKIGAEEVSRNLTTGLPCALKTNGTREDLPVEVAWKTVMFTNYYCARHFKNLSIEHSHFEQKMEMFFNRWMLHRWHNPGPSLAAYKYIFQMYDLEKFSKGLDRCVAASRAYSPYRKWIRRPSYTQYCGKNIFSEGGLDGNFDMMSSKVAITKTRFNEKAYCASSWHDAKSLFNITTQAPKASLSAGCIKYIPGEWRDVREPNYPWTQGMGSKKETLATLRGGHGSLGVQNKHSVFKPFPKVKY